MGVAIYLDKNNMNKFITYSTACHTYYDFGSVYSANLTAKTLPALKKEMVKFCNEQRLRINSDVECITFAPIKKNIETKSKKGWAVQFKKITNVYMHGDKKPDKKYYNKLEIK